MNRTRQAQLHLSIDEAVRWEAALMAFDRITAGVAPTSQNWVPRRC